MGKYVGVARRDLERWYLTDKLSARQIAKIVGCHAHTILDRLREHEVPIRSSPEGASLACQGRVSPNKGNRWTPAHHEQHRRLWTDQEFRERVIPKRSGANSPLWRGGVSRSDNLHLARAAWRKLARECYIRDNGRCRDCGVKCLSRAEAARTRQPARTIAAHHLIPRRLGGTDELANLVTLCASCHQKADARIV